MNEKLLKKLLFVLIVLSPILDLSFFYGQIATLIRIIFILVMFVITLKIDKKDKIRKYLYLYLFVVLIYFIIHDLNAKDFNSLVPGNFNYNTLSEALYFIKMIMSSIIIYVVFKSKLTLDELNSPINLALIMISGSIVLLNFLGLSYNSYGYETISANFFAWFTNHNYLFNELASKGFFELGNQITAILILYLPLTTYFLLKKFNIFNLISFLILLLSMLMLGTRISVYGSLLTLITIIFVYLFLLLIKKEKLNITSLVLILLTTFSFFIIIDYSPVKLKSDFYTEVYDKKDIDKVVTNSSSNKTKEETAVLNYIEENYDDKLIFEYFILESYPYQYDPEFWLEIMEEPVEKRVDTRFLEIEMVEQVVEINDNELDLILGITYTRIQNIFNIERDYIMQYYSLGIVGTILLLGSYFITIIIFIIFIVKDFKNKFNLKNILTLMSVSLILTSAYFSGNILNGLGCIIPLAIISGVLINNVKYDKITNEDLVKRCPMREKLEKVISVYKRDGFVETTKKIIKHINYNVFFKHNPKYIIDFYLHKKKYNEILDKILSSDYKYLIAWRGSFGWKVPLFQRPQHIARELSNNDCLVLYATYKDDKVTSINKIKENLYLINYQNKLFVRLLEQKINKITKPKFIQIYSTDWFKNTNDLQNFIDQGYKILYEYIDDLAPELTGTKELSKNIIEKYEFCINDSKNVLVVTSADKLYDDVYKVRKDKNLVFASNGVEYEHFKNNDNTLPEKLEKIVNLNKPIIGYYGALAKWFDYDLIKYISKERKDYQIVLIGLKYDTSYDLSNIDELDNVHYLGVVDYKELPNYVKYFDVATIPFLINDITKATSPCKLFEYMSALKPIVTTDLNECHKYKSVMIGKNKKEFIKKLDEALKLQNDKDYLELLDKEALENTWNAKARLIVAGISKMKEDD